MLAYVISSRVRVARNLAGYPFPPGAADEDRAAVVACVQQAAERQAWFPAATCLFMDDLHPLDRRLLEEKHLISPEFARPQNHRVAIIAGSQEFSVLVNEEDHLRIQALRPGYRVFAAWQQARMLEQNLGRFLDFARSDNEGYVTTCSSNRGSGMRASVMLFLPALIGMKQISALFRQMYAAGYTVRGLYGEGSQSFGSLIQISHHITATWKAGQRRELQRLHAACDRMIAEERRGRQRLVASHGRNWIRNQVEQIQHAVNTAETITFRAGMTVLSKLRLALALREESVTLKTHARLHVQLAGLDRLMMQIQPAHIRHSAGSSGQQHLSEDRLRAEILKQMLHIQV